MTPETDRLRHGQWQCPSDLPYARSHAPVVAWQGKLYVFGGGGPAFQSLNQVAIYNPETNAWRSGLDMPTKRSGTVAYLRDGKIWVLAGGYKKPDGYFQFLRTAEIYDPATDQWVAGPSLQEPHDYPAAAITVDETLLVCGGHHPAATLGGPRTDPGFTMSEALAPHSTAWTRLPDLQVPRFAAAGFVYDNRVYVAGGVAHRAGEFNNFDVIEVLDLKRPQRWNYAPWRLPWPAAGHALCVHRNHLFMFGGYSTESIHARAAICDLRNGVWHALPEMPYPRAAMGVAVLGDTLYLVGGWADDGRTPVASVIAYRCPELVA
ncbi:MAG: kelch repeat-containing protein [Pseudomonadota bacterium]